MSALDRDAAVRSGEALDAERLAAWLDGRLPERGAVTISQFPRGHSNLTYLVRTGVREYVLRRPPFGNVVKTAHDMSREYRMLRAVAPVFPAAPHPVLLCEDPEVIGAPFYLMERRTGRVLRGPGEALSAAEADRLCSAFVDTLVALHALDWRAIGLEGYGRPEGYAARQVTGWTARWEGAATDPVPDMTAVAAWLAGRIPADRGAAVVHNDYKFDNLLLDPADPGRIVALLDWEMATVGDPLLDLGSSLAYWIEPGDPAPLMATALGPTAAAGMWTRRRIIEAYGERSGRDPGALTFEVTFGHFKLAVIAQQIYARYVRGHTRDERFAGFRELVALVARQAARTIEQGALSPSSR